MKKYFLTLCLIVISICFVTFNACGESYDDFSLHFSSPNIQVEQGESEDYDIIIDNYFDTDTSFNFSFDVQIAKVSEPVYVSDGHFRITVTGKTPGNATLTITLLEGKKQIMVPVTVYEPITSISLKEDADLYIIRGQSLQLSDDLLNFYPLNTLERGVRFQLGAEIIENGLITTNELTPDELVVTAISLYDENISCSFTIRVLNKINTQNIILTLEDMPIPTISEDTGSYIELIKNDRGNFQKDLMLAYDENYEYKIFAKSTQDSIRTSQLPTMQNMMEVNIQATDFSLLDDILVIRVQYADYDNYYVDLEYKVSITCKAESVLINGQVDNNLINLFNNDDHNNAKQFLLSVIPQESNYSHISIEYYISRNGELNSSSYAQISQYICVSYGVQEVYDGIQISDLTLPIYVYGRDVLPENIGDEIVIQLVVQDNLTNNTVFGTLRFSIQKGATGFRVDNIYENSTIYVKNGETVTFDGFVVEEADAYVGIITAQADDLASNSLCTVVQTAERLASIDITAHQAGEAHYTLVLENGLSTVITIIIKDELDIDNLWFYVGTNDDNVAEVEYRQAGDNSTLDFLAVRGTGSITISANISPRDISSQAMYSISFESDDANILSDGNVLTFTVVDNIRHTINVKVRVIRVSNFILTVDEDVLNSTQFDFDVICFEPISNFTFDAQNVGDLDDSYASSVNVYDYNTPLGYVDTDMSKVQFRLMIDGVEFDVNDPIIQNLDLQFSFSVSFSDDGNGEYELTDAGSIVYGYFNSNELLFECNAIGNPLATFTITAKLYEYGNVISSTVKINIVRYIQVEEVWLYNYMEEIYLDPSHTQEVIYPYILPRNATNQNFTAWFEPSDGTSSTIVQIQYDSSKITIDYTGSGGGRGILKIVPNSLFLSSDRNEYLYGIEIPISVGDGSISNPLHIGSWEQLKNIDLSKYYIIDGTIDAGGEEISPLGELTGGLSGMTASDGSVSRIINFVVSDPYTISAGASIGEYYGLFSSVASGGYIMDLSITGSINITNTSMNAYIGLVAGVNNGVIKNVSVTLTSSQIETLSSNATYIGGAIGQNNSVYVIDIIEKQTGAQIFDKSNELNQSGNAFDNGQESSLSGHISNYYRTIMPVSTMFVYMPNGQMFNISLGSGNSYVGGIVGENRGLLKFRKETNTNTYNNFGVSSLVNLTIETTIVNHPNAGIGGAVGANNGGNIVNILATGRIKSLDSRNVGGLIGYMENGKVIGNVSRVYVRANTYVGGLIGFVFDAISENISNNLVQATDDRIQVGIFASLIVSNDLLSTQPLFNSNGIQVDNSNRAISYITRTKIQYTGQADNEGDINTYYGEIVAGANVQVEDTLFQKAGEDIILTNDTIILMYFGAQDLDNQSYLTKLNTQFLPDSLFNGSFDISITSNATSIISVTSDGQLRLHDTGTVILTLTSLLNASITKNVTCIVTNYISDLNLYSTSDYNTLVSQNSVINITNRNTVTLYPRMEAYISVGNMNVQLVENNIAQLEVISNEYISVVQSSKTVILQGIGTQNSQAPSEIEFYIYLDINGQKRYLQLVGDRYEFIQTSTDDIEPNAIIYTSYSQGIYNIESDKTNLTLIPSDVFSIKLSYLTDDIQDEIELSITYLENGETIVFGEDDFENYFIVRATEVYQANGRYYIDYTFEMNTENLIRIGDYIFSFSGADGAVTKNIYVTYEIQPINNVIVKNYSFTENEDIILIQTEDDYYVYNTSYSMEETNIVTAGEPNILKVVINPYFADYEYVEITNAQENIINGNIVLFGLLSPRDNQPGQAVISSNAIFTSTGIKVLKQYINGGELNVLYRMATNVIEGDSIVLNINFYNSQDEIVYSQQQKVLTIRLNKFVDVSIANREPSDKYYVARGYNYLLNVKTLGYDISDVVIESSSSYGKIINDNGNYYLRISNEINYPRGKEGYEFTVTYYGVTTVDGVTTSGLRNSFTCTIVEYVLGDLGNLNEIFSTKEIILNRGNSADVRDLIVDNIQVEYSGNASNAVNALKESLKQNGIYFYKYNPQNGFIRIVSENTGDLTKTDVSNDVFDLNGYDLTVKFVGENLFSLGVFANLQYLEGYVQVLKLTDEDIGKISDVDISEFSVSVNQSTLINSPLPIYSQEDLMNMSAGNHYILMNDITITTGFTPLDVEIARLDGNSHNIIFSGIYADYTNIENFGLFSVVGENTLLCNLTIVVGHNTIFNFRNEGNANAFNFGIICAENNGTITNCSVVSQDDSSSLIVTNAALVAISSLSNIASFVAINNGYITNSRVSLRVESYGANLAGFVAENNGHIASSYVKRSLIRNSSTNVNNATAGFVVRNNGTIFASYIEGEYSTGLSYVYASDINYIVRATSIAGAFAYINDGSISNCYANIPLTSSSVNSGFVCTNNGQILSSYSTSRLGDRDTGNYPFYITSSGHIEDSYYLKDSNFNVSINTSNEEYGEGLRPTLIIEFAIGYEVTLSSNNYIVGNKLFNNFAINSNQDITNGVWFYAIDSNSYLYTHNIATGSIITTSDYRNYLQYSRQITTTTLLEQGNGMQFRENRPQLVSANIIASSSKYIISQEYVEETGETLYIYAETPGSNTEGSLYNPHIVFSAVQFEENFISNSIRYINSQHYRLVRDIDYTQENLVVSSLFNYVLAGYFEGNGLTISNFSINTSVGITSGGYFSQIGYGSNYATIQNVIFAPRYINLPNAICVGTVAGTANRIYAYNITVDGYNDSSVSKVILGKNIVGGIFGRTVSSFDIQNVYSSISTNAYQTNTAYDWSEQSVQSEILYEEGSSNYNIVSYSGGIVGYLGGVGTLKNAYITNAIASIGMIGGFMFGGIGINAEVRDIEYQYEILDNYFIRASAYGGIIVGDLKGVLRNVNVLAPTQDTEGEATQQESYYMFVLSPKVPLAIGGLSGIVRGNETQSENLIDCSVDLDIEFNQEIVPNSVGGLVGRVVENIVITNCEYTGSLITGRNAVGGFIGEIYFDSTFGKVNLNNVKIGTSNERKSEIRAVKPAQEPAQEISISSFVGGVIGALTSDVGLSSTSSENGLLINGFDIYANVTTNITIYGTQNVGSDLLGVSYSVYASKLVGGYNGANFNANNLTLTIENVEDTNYENISLLLSLTNLRNGDGNFMGNIRVALEFNVYISSWIYGLRGGPNISVSFVNTSSIYNANDPFVLISSGVS